MARLFVITFAVLGWAWYELSGGADFEPGSHGVQILAAVDAQALPANAEPAVSRADTSAVLTALNAPVTPEPAAPAQARTAPQQDAKTIIVPVLSPQAQENQPVITPVLPGVDRIFATNSIDYREVTGSRVNVRNGPGTSFQVVMQLRRGDEVEILQDPGEGWVKLRSLDGSRVGWMSDSFLIASN